MNADRKKQIISDYKSKRAVGGVYAIVCSGNQRRCVKASPDIGGIKNRYQFAMAIKGCPDPVFRKEWEAYGSESFSLHILEELEMKEDQSAREFAEELELLRDLWLEKDAGNA